MAKKGRKRTPPRRGHLRSLPTTSEGSTSQPADAARAEAQPLMGELRTALRAEHPLALLGLISSMLHVWDPRRVLAPGEEPPATGLDGLLDSFVGTDLAETTAALRVISALVPDDLVRARLRKVLTGRRQPMPAWIRGLDQAEVTRVELMTETLGDGDNYLIEVRLAGGELMSPIVYVDHNLGTVVKNAFVIPEGLDRVVARYEELMDETQSIAPLDPADARVQVARAIDQGAKVFPPLEDEDWPQSRPLVEWVVRLMPAGGTVPERPTWTQRDRAKTVETFFASAQGRALDSYEDREILDLLWDFGLEVGPGDPLRWSPVNVEMLLVQWLPEMVEDDADPEQVLAVLRAWIRWCHQQRGLTASQLSDTLASVDRWTPAFHRLAEAGLGQARLDAVNASVDEAIARTWAERIDQATGGRAQTLALTDDPLPDEPFDWTQVPEDVHDRVGEVLAVVDRCCEELFDVEHRTAARRFLARAAAGDPKIFRRKGDPARSAAAVCWAVSRANDTVGPDAPLTNRELLAWFGLTGSIASRADVFLAAIGIDPQRRHGFALGSVDYLVGAHRRQLARTRDRWFPHLQ